MQSININCSLKILSEAKKSDFPRVDIIAVHGSHEDVNSMWTWRKRGKDTAWKNLTGSGKLEGTLQEKAAPKQGESDIAVSAGNAPRPNLPAETVPQTTSKLGEPGETAPDTTMSQSEKAGGATPETSVPQSSKVDETTPETKRPQLNMSEEIVQEKLEPKRSRSIRKPFSTDSSKKPESKRTEPTIHEHGAEESSKKSDIPSKRDSRFQILKPGSKKTE